MKRIYSLVVASLLALSTFAVGCSSPTPSPAPASQAPAEASGTKEEASNAEPTSTSDMKVAMVMSGPINDAGWNQSAYEGLQVVKSKYNADTAYTENIPQPDFETVIRDYADKGYNLIICHGFEFSDAVKVVAPTFPDSTFAVVNGDSFQEPNMLSFRFNTPETGFLAGTVAALASKNNSVAMIGGTKLPHIMDALNSFEAGAKYIKPDISVQLGYTESMTDISKGKEMAISMIEKGADVVVCNANQVGLGVIDAAKTKGVTALGYINDQYDVATDTVLVSIIQSVSDLIVSIADKKAAGDTKAGLYLSGAKDNGVVRLSDWHGNESKLSAEDMAKIEEVYGKIIDGSLKKDGILIKSVFEQ